jgi:hypothetical protein
MKRKKDRPLGLAFEIHGRFKAEQDMPVRESCFRRERVVAIVEKQVNDDVVGNDLIPARFKHMPVPARLTQNDLLPSRKCVHVVSLPLTVFCDAQFERSFADIRNAPGQPAVYVTKEAIFSGDNQLELGTTDEYETGRTNIGTGFGATVSSSIRNSCSAGGVEPQKYAGLSPGTGSRSQAKMGT